MSKAFVDTTILTDILLKPTTAGPVALQALSRHEQTELPVYAIKEFKAGPLYAFAWIHNKLTNTKSFSATWGEINRMARTLRRNVASTATEALMEAGSFANRIKTIGGLDRRYGSNADPDAVMCDEYRLAIKSLIFRAWHRRRSVTTHVVEPLKCYLEVDPYEKNGLIEASPYQCRKDKDECCLGPILRARPDDLDKLRKATETLPKSAENKRRWHTLNELRRKSRQKMDDKMCRSLGDAYFAFFAPNDSKILTTNAKHHDPLARALGKQTETP